MGFIGFLALLAAIWLLWNISRNTADALDKQTALQYEIVALEKRLDEISDLIRSAAPGDSASAGESVGPVNLNTASATALTHLPKVGKATAQKIIDARPFKSVDELKQVTGVSDELFAELKDLVTV